MPARGRLQGDAVVVPDEKEANSLYNKGAYGTPQSGGGLKLDLAEAVHLVESNRLAVEGETAGSLLRRASASDPAFEIRYVVYRDLRGRTFVVKSGSATDLHVYPRGSIPGRAGSTHLVRCASERGALDAEAVVSDVARARKQKKTLLLALVDEEGDLTYYEASTHDLTAEIPPLPPGKARAHLLADRVLVLDREEGKALSQQASFGRDVGVGLQLSLPEAHYLLAHGRLALEDAAGPVGPDELARRARALEPDFDVRREAYRHLRERGVVVKTGFKYGTHFRVYLGSPSEEHAPFLVHALPAGRQVPWPEVAGFVRLAHGVRKRLFFAVQSGGGFTMLELARRKP